ncbi:ATP-binding cassette domain-containing protein [Desulfocicer niacini]
MKDVKKFKQRETGIVLMNHGDLPDGEILRVNRLRVAIREKISEVVLLQDVNFSLVRGEIHGLVGESGCGKSLFARTLVRLEAPAYILSGSISVDGYEVADRALSSPGSFRGKKISLVLQHPYTAMDPVFTLASQFKDALSIMPGPERSMERVYTLLEKVGISSPASRCRQYPHEWSLGMLQRAQLVMALLADPRILILDEVTSSLDPTMALLIVELVLQVRQDCHTSFILITHDLAMAAHVCDRISVMHQGTIVETRGVEDLFKHPEHPYTADIVSNSGIRGDDLCLIR